jgi:two-component sensor histidine kinase
MPGGDRPTLGDTMNSLSERLTQGSASAPAQVDHARRLVADWQLLADLSFADLTLWVPLHTGAWWCVAQVRPLTAPTSQLEDLVGSEVEGPAAEAFVVVHREGRPVTEGEQDRSGSTPRRRREVVPVRHDGVVVAVLARDTNLAVTRSPSTLELTYLDIAADLCLMVSAGTFPPQKPLDAELSPRVGDGLVRLDADGRAAYASPNALSAYRRLGVTGDVVGADLARLTRDAAIDRVAGETVAAGIRAAVAGRFPDLMEVESVSATLLVRALPLQAPGAEEGALVLVRDVTDLRRRDRALLTKDATIREIHHRVKNNLQTVAALLRLQARRMTEPAAREALEESVRRVSSIAVVHETLAGSREDVVDVDDVLDRVLTMLGDLTSVGPAARTRRVGTFGELPAVAATPLVLAVTELLHNAAEHAFPEGSPGSIELLAERDGDDLVVRVRDDGRGLPEGFDSSTGDGLGLQIVRTLVASELGGGLAMGRPADGSAGTEVVLTLPGAGRRRR